MKQVLALSNKLIFQIEFTQPNPQENILWIFFPSAKTKSDDYVNERDVWIGLYANLLANYPQTQKEAKKYPKIIFKTKTSLINPNRVPPNFILIKIREQKCYFLEQNCKHVKLTVSSADNLILPEPESSCLLVNQTVFVDPRYGNDRTGRIEQLLYPFKTINAAILAIPFEKRLNENWEIHLTSGTFPEVVKIPSRVYLVGQGISLTSLAGLRIEGQGDSGASNLTIDASIELLRQDRQSTILRPLSIEYNAPGDQINKQIMLTNLNVIFKPHEVIHSGEFNVVEIRQSSGKNGNVSIRECQINADFSEITFNQTRVNLIRTIDQTSPLPGLSQQFEVESRNSTFRVTSPPAILDPLEPEISSRLGLVHSTNANFSDVYDKFVLTSHPLQRFQQTLFISEGQSFEQNHATIQLNVPVLPEPPVWENTPDYLIWQAIDQNSTAGRIKSSSPDVVFSNVRQDKITLADRVGPLARIRILGASFPLGRVPKIDPNNKQITYAAHDGDGGTITSGSLAARIRKSSENLKVQPEDHTVVADVFDDIELYDIPEVSQTQIVEGSLLTIINPLLYPIMVKGVISGVPEQGYTLKPLETIQLNADQTQFYLTSSVSSSPIIGQVYSLQRGPLPVGPSNANYIIVNLAGGGGGAVLNEDGDISDPVCSGVPGGRVQAILPYDPNTNYNVVIGSQGGNSNYPNKGDIGLGGISNDGTSSITTGGNGGLSGNGSSGGGAGDRPGGGGGAYSALTTDTEILLIAAGSGGAGNSVGCNSGGIGGVPPNGYGQDGEDDGGGGATQTSAGEGSGGATPGANGSSGTGFSGIMGGKGGTGGNSGSYPSSAGNGSGGGGGGYYGGGGGGSGYDVVATGGGGGSSYANPDASSILYSTASSLGDGYGFIEYLYGSS